MPGFLFLRFNVRFESATAMESSGVLHLRSIATARKYLLSLTAPIHLELALFHRAGSHSNRSQHTSL